MLWWPIKASWMLLKWCWKAAVHLQRLSCQQTRRVLKRTMNLRTMTVRMTKLAPRWIGPTCAKVRRLQTLADSRLASLGALLGAPRAHTVAFIIIMFRPLVLAGLLACRLGRAWQHELHVFRRRGCPPQRSRRCFEPPWCTAASQQQHAGRQLHHPSHSPLCVFVQPPGLRPFWGGPSSCASGLHTPQSSDPFPLHWACCAPAEAGQPLQHRPPGAGRPAGRVGRAWQPRVVHGAERGAHQCVQGGAVQGHGQGQKRPRHRGAGHRPTHTHGESAQA